MERGSLEGSDDGLYMYDSDGSIVEKFTAQNGLISSNVRALLLDGEGRVMAGTDKGISMFDTKSSTWTQITGTAGLPYTDITRISFGPKGDLLVGTTWGAAHKAADRWHYFAGKRWVPSDLITAVAMGPDGTIWIGTKQGISKVERIPMTLEEKAKHYDEITQARHSRMGMVESVYLPSPGSLSKFVQHDADNDGLWTQMYIAAESFRYAVTKDPEAKKNARLCGTPHRHHVIAASWPYATSSSPRARSFA
jgi:ligand-binding sensor domain-containing protein